jgi:hypothetical protein
MTCETARILLLFYRPGQTADLAAEDVAALEGHLVTCPACAAAAGRQSAADEAIGRAFREVSVPGALKDRLHTRTAEAAGQLWRNKWATRASVMGLVAALWLTVWGVVIAINRPTLDTFALANDTQTAIERPESMARVWLNDLGLPGPLPEEFEFGLLSSFGHGELAGVRVPVLEFRNNGGFARVYLLRPGQFHTKDAAETQNSLVTVRLYKDRPAPGWVVVVVHTGTSLQPFLRVPAAPA